MWMFLRNLSKASRARRAGVKKSMLFLAAALLIFSAGCGAQQNENDALREVLRAIGTEVAKATPAADVKKLEDGATPTPLAAETNLQSSSWPQRIAGWWVEVSLFTDPEHPKILYFTEGGRVCRSPDDYDRMVEGEDVDCDAWMLADGKPQYVELGDAAPVYGSIEIGADDVMRIKGDGIAWEFERNTGLRAITILMNSGNIYLADGVKEAFILLGEELSEEEQYATVWLNEAVFVDYGDTALIAKYGLEDVFEGDGAEYYVYSDDAAWRPMFVMPDGGTTFQIVDYDEDGYVIYRKVDFEAFKEHVEKWAGYGEDGGAPLLVSYSDQGTDGIVFSIREVYLP